MRRLTQTLATLQQPPWPVLNRHARVALATVALNFSVLAVRTSFAHAELLLPLITEVRRALTQILGSDSDSEALYRALIALGNLVRAVLTQLCSPCGAALGAQRSAALGAAELCAARLSEPRVATVWSDLSQLRS